MSLPSDANPSFVIDFVASTSFINGTLTTSSSGVLFETSDPAELAGYKGCELQQCKGEELTLQNFNDPEDYCSSYCTR